MNIILEDFRQHRRDPFAWGFWALLIHRLGTVRNRFRNPLIRKPWGLIHKLAAKWAELAFGISIGINVKIGRRLTIEHFGGIIIHNDVIIGDDVIIRQGVTLGNRRLDAPLDAPRIGSRVNIGAGAKILGAVVIGDDAKVGANAVVLEDVPDGAIAVGVPARIIARSPAWSGPASQRASHAPGDDRAASGPTFRALRDEVGASEL